MEQQGKTAVQVIQELIAMLTTRKEACEKIASRKNAQPLNGRLNDLKKQSDQYLSELQVELSSFGDAVMADVDRDNDYNNAWKKAMESEGSSADELWQNFLKMEELLKAAYLDSLSSSTNLPDSLKELLEKQSGGLS